jgi:Tfp pilus assembly protein PilE
MNRHCLHSSNTPGSGRSRRGLGLIEVLLVIALTALLASAVLQLLDQFSWVTRSSRTTARRDIRARAVAGEIRDVLRAVSRADMDVQDSDEETDSPVKTRHRAENQNATAFTIVGERTSIAILSSRKIDQMPQWTAFFLSESGRTTTPILPGDSSPLQTSTNAAAGTLVKLTIPHLPQFPQNAARNTSERTETFVADRIADLMFQYFDGSEWHDRWDQRVSSGPLAAVRMTVRLQDTSQFPGEPDRVRPDSVVDFRTVVNLTEP